MFTNLSSQLLVLMLGSALAGVVVGVCIYRLRTLGLQKRMLLEQHDLVSSKNSKISDLEQERDIVFQALQSQEKESLVSKALIEKTQAQHEALQVHARLQAQRLQTLQTELQSAEEKNIVLQRDFSNYKLNRSRELQSLHASNGADSRLPLLNKRAAGEYANTSHSGRYSSGMDKDFPSISESDLPDSLELEDVSIASKGSSEPHG